MWIGLIVASAVLLDTTESDDKVVNGTYVGSISERPYMVQISEWGQLICGGGIIQPKWILTASHCLTRNKTEMERYRFIAGSVLITPPDKTAQIRKAKSMLLHPQYANLVARLNRTQLIYDIGAVEVKEKFKLNAHVKPMAFFPIDPVIYENQIALLKTNPKLDCSLSGWGQISTKKIFSNRMKKVQLEFISDEDCQSRLAIKNPQFRNFNFSENKQYCVKSVNGYHEGPYDGDSGGPLMCNGFVVGVQSCAGFDGHVFLPIIIQSVSVMMDLFEERNILCDEPSGCRYLESTTAESEISASEEPPSPSARPSDDSDAFLTRTNSMYVLISAIVSVTL